MCLRDHDVTASPSPMPGVNLWCQEVISQLLSQLLARKNSLFGPLTTYTLTCEYSGSSPRQSYVGTGAGVVFPCKTTVMIEVIYL